MSVERTRERIVELVRKMQEHTVDRGCAPAEAAHFAAKCAEWVERYQINEAELRGKGGVKSDDIEVCENLLRTGKKVFNPGMTAVVSGLAVGMCCKVILLHKRDEAVYGVIGESLDADCVCQIATTVVPSLQFSALMEGREHGYEKAGLVRWSNQYLIGAGSEIQRRLESDRRERSDVKQVEQELLSASSGAPCQALVVVTGETIAVAKREAALAVFNEMYPRTQKTFSRSEYNHVANARGREAGKRVGLNIALDRKS